MREDAGRTITRTSVMAKYRSLRELGRLMSSMPASANLFAYTSYPREKQDSGHGGASFGLLVPYASASHVYVSAARARGKIWSEQRVELPCGVKTVAEETI